MTDYMLIYESADKAWMKRSPEEKQKIMEQWGAWFKQLETSGHLRNGGAPLAPGGATLEMNGGTITTDKALSEVKELIGGFSIIAADSLDQAIELAKGTPFLRNNPTGTVVIRAIAPM